MSGSVNEYQQPTGEAMPGWQARPFPQRVVLEGNYCHLAPLDPESHTKSLLNAIPSE